MENDLKQDDKRKKYYNGFCQNLLNGIDYYLSLEPDIVTNKGIFYDSLKEASGQVEAMRLLVK